MFKRIALFLLAAALLLCACGKNEPAQESSAAQDPSDPSSASVFTWERPTVDGVSTDDWETVPAYTDSPLISPDPNRQVYISLANQDCDFYPDLFYRAVTVTLLSKEKIDPAKISVEIPMQTGYSVSVLDWTEDCRELACRGVANLGLADYQYFSLHGIDWAQIGQGFLDSMKASSYWNSESDFELGQKVLTAYSENYQAKMAEFKALYESASTEDLPMFYYYNVTIGFTDLVDETVESLTFYLDGTSYPIEFGQWRMHSQQPESVILDGILDELTFSNLCVLALTENAWRDGYARLPNALEFTARTDITLTGLTAEQTSVELLGAKVQFTEGDGNGMDFYWDCSQALDVAAGSHVVITPYLYDERFASYEVGCTMFLTLQYNRTENAGSALSATLCGYLARYNNVWDSYLLALHGYDIGQYYRCYANLFDRFLNTMPESWKR